MNVEQACEIIEDIATDHGSYFLETLIYMGDRLDDFTDREVLAYRVFMAEAKQMFAPKVH